MGDETDRRPALHDRHVAAEATMGAEAGWHVPLQFAGVAEEVAHVRRRAGVMDVSHIARIRVRGDQALAALERLCTMDVAHQEDFTAARTLLCNQAGGIVDDGFLVRLSEEWLLTCSPINYEKVLAHLEAVTGGMDVKISDQTTQTTHLAVTGPQALRLLDAVLPEKASALPPGGVKVGSLLLARYIAMRVGYSGQFCLEVILPNLLAWQAWRFITQKAGAHCTPPVGLAARDVLRIEAGLPRYGHEINETTDPFAAGLERLLDFDHDFLGRSALLERRRRPPSRRLTGLLGAADGAIPALGSAVADAGGREIGAVTSGAFSPTLQRVIAMGYVTNDTNVGTDVHVQTQDGPHAMQVTGLPFVGRQ